MFVLRCTRKLLKRIQPSTGLGTEGTSATTLGDWCANLLIVRRQHLVLAVSQVTLLPVVLPLAPAKTFVDRLPESVSNVLGALGIDPKKIASEVDAMGACVVTTTNDRSVLGSMNDFSQMLDSYLDERTLTEVSLRVAQAPCGPIGMASPDDATRRLFSMPTLSLT
jgi:hypothetical protein